MSARLQLWAVVWAGALAGCALPGAPADRDRATLEVVVQRGFRGPAAAVETAEAVAVLMDVTPSMAADGGAGVSRLAAAREAAARFVRALPADDAVAVYAVGAEGSERCNDGLRTRRSGAGGDRAELLADLTDLEPTGEASLADGLVALADDLARADALAGARVVVYSDLAPQCGGDLCGALAAAVDGGARVDLVIFGAAQPPACVDDPDLGAYRGDASTAPVRFRVSTSGRHRRTAEGIGGAGPVVVPAGSVRLVVDLQPALQFDALPLVPGGTARLTVIDFPALDPPVREWSWDLDAGAASPEAGGPGDDGP